jgi:hypothetical protein
MVYRNSMIKISGKRDATGLGQGERRACGGGSDHGLAIAHVLGEPQARRPRPLGRTGDFGHSPVEENPSKNTPTGITFPHS